jgi:hypothetical protein
VKHTFVLLLVCIVAVVSVPASSQTRRSSRHSTSTPKPSDVSATELQAGRDRVSAELKTLTHFLYLFGAIAKGMESAMATGGDGTTSPALTEQNERTKAKIRESVKDVRIGLEKLETDLSANTAFKGYYRLVIGVADTASLAEKQAAANRFEDAGKSLLKASDQLADALAKIH